MQQDLTQGNITRILLRFSGPYLVASFLQTFYGLADMFITGQYNGAGTISAVAVGSQVMHMLTVVIVGLAMGSTVSISHAVGAKDGPRTARSVGNSVTLFAAVAAASTVLLLMGLNLILRLLAVPPEAYEEARRYLFICFAGVPFIIAYNVISSIFRGLGDTKSPMYFVAIAGVFNIVLDYVLIGPFAMGAAGAALATVAAQGLSVGMAFLALKRFHMGVKAGKEDLAFEQNTIHGILAVGIPIAFQEGLIQISFLVITAIANARGVSVAAAVGIVEKIICFLFLVPSAMSAAVSSVAAQNAGAGYHNRSAEALRFGIRIIIGFGFVILLQRILQRLPEGHVFLCPQHGQCSAGAYSGSLPCIKAVPGNSVSHGTCGAHGVTSLRGHLPGAVSQGERVLDPDGGLRGRSVRSPCLIL